MKRLTPLLIAVIFTVCVSSLSAQRTSIGFHGNFNEYVGDLSNNNYRVLKFDFVKPGGGISLQQYLNSSFNLHQMFSYNKLQWQNAAKTSGVEATFLTFNGMLKYKFNNGYIFKEDAAF